MQRVLVVGANRGIGLELCRAFAARGDNVYALCRQESAELREIPNTTILTGFDVSNDKIMADLKATVNLPAKLDIVVANAGVANLKENFHNLKNTEDVLTQFNTNALGPIRVAKGVLPRLSEGSKFAIVSAIMASVGGNKSSGMLGYRMSKSAANQAGRSLAIDLRKQGIPVGMFHPGFVKTEMTNFTGQTEPPKAASMLLKRIDALSMENSGEFVNHHGKAIPW